MASKPFEEKQPDKLAKEKELAAAEKIDQKEPLKDKHEKETKDTKDHKDQKEQKDKHEKEKHEKEKHEKEQHKPEKHEIKEVHKEKEGNKEQLEIHPQALAGAAAAAPAAASIQKQLEKFVYEKHLSPKEIKLEKNEIKEHKFEKFEIKEHKLEKFEKPEKLEFEVAGPGQVGPGDPVEQRLANLESAVTQLLHFIPENLRPDLSKGALKQEADAGKKPAAGNAKEEKPKS